MPETLFADVRENGDLKSAELLAVRDMTSGKLKHRQGPHTLSGFTREAL